MNESLKDPDSLDADTKSLRYMWAKLRERVELYKQKLEREVSIRQTMSSNEHFRNDKESAEIVEDMLRNQISPHRDSLDRDLVDIDYLRALLQDLKKNKVGQLDYCSMKNGWSSRQDDIINYPNLVDLYFAILQYKATFPPEKSSIFEEWLENQLIEVRQTNPEAGGKIANRLLLALRNEYHSQRLGDLKPNN